MRRITVWVAISSHGLLGPIFCEETVNSERYLSMLRNTFVPHLLVTSLPLQSQCFMQDGARPQAANVVLDFLHDTLDSRVVWNRFPGRFACGQNRPPNSPDLNPCDYFLCGFLKEKIFQKKAANSNGIESTNHRSCWENLPDVMMGILSTWFTEDKSPCNCLSFCMLVSSIVIEIKILLIDQILGHFMHHSVFGEEHNLWCSSFCNFF
jgi:hypothetical protein